MLALIVLLLPPAEIMLGLNLSRHFGGWWVVAGLAAGVVLGTALIRLRGQVFFRQAMAALQRQQMPTEELVGGIAWYVAGALFIFPGFISDALALLVLLPPVRRRVLERFRRRAEEQLLRMQGGTAFQWTPRGGWQGPQGQAGQPWQQGPAADGDVFEGEGREIVEDAPTLPQPKTGEEQKP